MPVDAARIVAEHLVDADGCGVSSHGIIRIPQYIQALEQQRVIPDAKLTVVRENAATAVLDGGHGFGQVMARAAMDVAIERAARTGVGAVTLVNCGHTGRIGSYTEQAARSGMAGLFMSNTGGHGQWVAPFGGLAGRLATNPFSMAVPTESGEPLMFDFATSVAPEGRVRSLMTAGQPLPAGWIIDHEGHPSTNSADLYGPPRGALLPFGGHKGFGLSMLIDALAGGLSGAGCCTSADRPMDGKTDGVFLLAINVASFCPLAEFQSLVTKLIGHVKSCPAADNNCWRDCSGRNGIENSVGSAEKWNTRSSGDVGAGCAECGASRRGDSAPVGVSPPGGPKAPLGIRSVLVEWSPRQAR